MSGGTVAEDITIARAARQPPGNFWERLPPEQSLALSLSHQTTNRRAKTEQPVNGFARPARRSSTSGEKKMNGADCDKEEDPKSSELTMAVATTCVEWKRTEVFDSHNAKPESWGESVGIFRSAVPCSLPPIKNDDTRNVVAPAKLQDSYAAPRRRSPSVGGMNITTTVREPHRGQRRRLATMDSGKSRPRVATSVSMSRS